MEVYTKPFPGKDQDGYVASAIPPLGVLLAVVDGHGGWRVRDKVCQKLASVFQKFLESDLHLAFRETLRELDLLCCERDEGAVLTAAFVSADSKAVTFAQLGDTVGLCDLKDGGFYITPDHNVRQNEREREAAVRRGGVYELGYLFEPGKSFGLQAARALGDKAMGNVILSEPEIITVFPESALLLCSDGFFDPLHEDPRQTAHFLQKVFKRWRNGEKLSHIAQDAGPFYDDATAVAVRLPKTE